MSEFYSDDCREQDEIMARDVYPNRGLLYEVVIKPTPSLPYVELLKFDLIKKWCDENLKDLWNTLDEWNTISNESLVVTYFFENEEDAIAFKLRWL